MTTVLTRATERDDVSMIEEDAEGVAEGSGRQQKAAGAFRTISEVADELGVPQHVLRFWETRFFQVRPLKRGGGRRYYRPEDVALIKKIHHLLYTEGYTIKGVQKLLKTVTKAQLLAENGVSAPAPAVTEARAYITQEPANEDVAADVTDVDVAPMTAALAGLTGEQRAVLESALAELKALKEELGTA